MRRFSLHLSKVIPRNTKIVVYELCKNGKSLFEEFYEKSENERKLYANITKALRIIEDTANLQRKPKKKFRQINNSTLNCKVYEAKADDVRIYLFEERKTGRIIVLGGVKGTQKRDIGKVISTIKEYYNEK